VTAEPLTAAGPQLHRFAVRGVPLPAWDEEGSIAADRIAGELWNDVYGLESIAFAPGDVVVDVGAHVGLVSVYLAKRWPFLRIHAFEPHPANHRNCATNLSLNGVADTVSLSPLAITGDGRPLFLQWLPVNTGGASAVFAMPAARSVGPLPSTTLEDAFTSLLAPGQRCKLLKLDCEGLEYEILARPGILERVDHLAAELHEPGLPAMALDGDSCPTSTDRVALAELCAGCLPPERLRLVVCPKTD
jgi:FkbM family methyltransferase